MGVNTTRRTRGPEWLFAAIGIALIAWCGFGALQAKVYQTRESSTLDRMVVDKKKPTAPRAAKAKNQLIGRLEIPRLKMSVMVVDGDDEKTLRTAAGHLPDTPLPWEFGNSAVAGHRDGLFRPLRSVRVTDRMRLTTPHGNFQYAVSNIRIIEPNDLSVLVTKGQSSLTLITCYPFNFVGQAPKRFIVQADHVPN